MRELFRSNSQRFLFFAAIWLVGLCTIALSSATAEIKISYQHNSLIIENDFFKRAFKDDRSGKIYNFYPTSWFDKKLGIELLDQRGANWFEFCINDQLICSETGGWQYQGYQKRQLENGGIEIVIQLAGQKEASAVHGLLKLNYRIQVFSNSALVRERLEISAKRGKTVHLNKFEGKISMSFPRYHWIWGDVSNLRVREIQLANWEGEVLDSLDWALRPNDRLQLTGGKTGRNLSQNHCYHPRRQERRLFSRQEKLAIKGPVVIVLDPLKESGTLVVYEHGSPDNDPSQDYLAVELEKENEGIFSTKVTALKGAYFEGQEINSEQAYKTVWVDVGFFHGNSFDSGEANFWNFVYYNQCEHLAPRRPTIYYNTWGMQRDEQKETKKRPQQILAEKRVLQEIEYAHQLGVDVLVIDDGWQNYFGDWQPVADRFPNGFKKIKAKLDSLGMRLGIWLAAEGIDPNSRLYLEHPKWLVRNEDGSETIGRWNKPIGCFSSGYKDYFVQLCKYWIDQGVTYFKWDGLDKHPCYAPNHRHGDDSVSPQERALCSGYNFILEVTDAARQITEYHPEVIIVFDVTEKSRNIGLAFLGEARFFWINNGATWYDDLSYYRAKSIRTVANLYNQIIPTLLQTSANYPHQSEMYGAQMYNVHTTLLGGNGFWGDLSEMTAAQRERAGEVVRLYKQVAPTVVSTRPLVTGRVGASPEIYEFIDQQKSEGMVIAFSGSALQTNYSTRSVDKERFFCVLRNAYQLKSDGTIILPFLFPQPDATCAAFVISASHAPGRIESSSCWLKNAEISDTNSIVFVNGAPGRQRIFWHGARGKPAIHASEPRFVKIQIINIDDGYQIIIEELKADVEIEVYSRRK